MVGNSMKSDVLPVIEAGGWGVFVPHGLAWALEHADAPEGHRPLCRNRRSGSACGALQQIETQE